MMIISEFFHRFGMPELVVTLIITLIIVSIHEWRNVLRLFKDDAKEENKE